MLFKCVSLAKKYSSIVGVESLPLVGFIHSEILLLCFFNFFLLRFLFFQNFLTKIFFSSCQVLAIPNFQSIFSKIKISFGLSDNLELSAEPIFLIFFCQVFLKPKEKILKVFSQNFQARKNYFSRKLL